MVVTGFFWLHFVWLNTVFPQLIRPFQATCRRNLGLGPARGGRVGAPGGRGARTHRQGPGGRLGSGRALQGAGRDVARAHLAGGGARLREAPKLGGGEPGPHGAVDDADRGRDGAGRAHPVLSRSVTSQCGSRSGPSRRARRRVWRAVCVALTTVRPVPPGRSSVAGRSASAAWRAPPRCRRIAEPAIRSAGSGDRRPARAHAAGATT